MKNDRIYRIDVRMIRSRLDELAALALSLIVAPTTDHDPGDEDRS